MIRLGLAVVAIICALAIFADRARAGIYTTTYATADGRVIICTTITDINGNPTIVNCFGG